MSLTSIPNIIPVLSGKGGVGKSSVTVQLALALSLEGKNVGVLDIDLTGPSIPRLFAIEEAKIKQAPGGWLPVQVHTKAETTNRKRGALYCMSLGFLLRDRGDAVVWRGPKKTAMVKQLLSDVLWPRDLDYLLVDTPPGTSDEHISLLTNLMDPSHVTAAQKLAAVIVTTPQAIATADVRKELSFCQKTSLKVLGVIENMAGYVCPCCGEVTNVFSKGGGEVMAREWGVRFLSSAPIDSEGWNALVEEGRTPVYGTQQQPITSEEPSSQPFGNGVAASESSRNPHELAEKYLSCSLYPIFHNIVQNLATIDACVPNPDATS